MRTRLGRAHRAALVAAVVSAACWASPAGTEEGALGQFDGHGDVGSPRLPGAATYNAVSQEYRKAGVIARRGLDADSPYADAVVHGDGLASLQYRRAKGAPTEEVRSELTGADVLQLERKGTTVTLSAARFGETVLSFDGTMLGISDQSAADGNGTETRLTTWKALDDGPEYAPDGRFIYFNSTRSGTMLAFVSNTDME